MAQQQPFMTALFGTPMVSNTSGASSSSPSTMGTSSDGSSNHQKNTKDNHKVAVWWLFGIIILYFVLGLLQHKKFAEDLKPGNVGMNLHNILVITLSAVIGMNILKVFFHKLATLSIPGVSSFAGRMTPFFK